MAQNTQNYEYRNPDFRQPLPTNRRLNPQQPTSTRGVVLQPNYLCDRCKQPGHYIQDCPTNENQLFEPFKPSGVPMSQIWRQNGTNAREWQENSHKVFKSLLKQSEIYKIEDLAYKSDNDDEEKPKTASDSKLPPSLECMLCKGLIHNAMLTPCCTSSACYECLKSYLTADHKLASSRAGVCPFPDCKEQDVYVQDLIYNHALSKAADWFRRQQIAKAELVDLEIDKDQNLDRDLGSAARQMIEQAKVEARNFLKNGTQGKQTSLEEALNQAKTQLSQTSQAQQMQAQLAQIQQQQKSADQFKFNPLLHVGTRFDPHKGRRVAVSDESQLPKINQLLSSSAALSQLSGPQLLQFQQLYRLLQSQNQLREQGIGVPSHHQTKPQLPVAAPESSRSRDKRSRSRDR